MKKIVVVLVIFALVIPSLASAQGSGQVALVGTDGNIYLYDVASQSLDTVTDDAVPGQKAYNWPTWSNDQQLAYFGVDAGGANPYRMGIFVRSAAGESTRVYASLDEVFTYAYWSPADCPLGNCRDLAVLYNLPGGGLGMRRVRSAANYTVDEIAEGAPFYWDWAPDGQSMFWARFSIQLELYDVASEDVVQTFDERPGFQRAVDWSPVDDRLLTTITPDNITSSLLVFDGEERVTLAESLQGVVSFEWSPDGAQVAYTTGDDGSLFIVDARTGEEVAALANSTLAFFWSPDGTQLAYLTISRGSDTTAKRAAQTDVRAEWNVYDVAAETSTRFSRFLPTQDMLYYLQFFDQFARSHRLWSPDSRYIVYGELRLGGEQIVSLIDVQQPTAEPQTLYEGTIGIFSWQ